MQINENGDRLVVGLCDGVCLVYDYSMQVQTRMSMGGGFDDLKRPISSNQFNQGWSQQSAKKAEKLKFELQIDVKNGNGKFSSGRKVTGIDFLNHSIAMVTTNDSRVRFINIVTGRVLLKIKGHINDELHVRASLSPDTNFCICGSEDGNVYLWSQIESNLIAYNHNDPEKMKKQNIQKAN